MTVELYLLSRVAYRDQEITGPRVRGLLALLAGDLRTGCSTARLVNGLWPDEQPENPTKALQVLVSRTRGQFGTDLIVSTPTGYRLSLGEDQIDASVLALRAAASGQRSRAGDHEAALTHAEAGLALWDGAADSADDLDDPVAALRAERAGTHLSLVRARALALSRLGRPAEAVEPLNRLVRELPRDEEVLLELLRCEMATAGPAAALIRYDGYRRELRDELGADPGPALQALYQQLLQGTAPAIRHGVAHEPNPLLGRAADIAAVANLLRTSRVTSIVGPGGLGKTRLANVVSREAEFRVVHLVALAGVGTDDDVVNEVRSALGVAESRRSPGIPADVLAGIVNALTPGPALLVLDNCEHVIRGAAELVHALVSTTQDLRILTTSRAPLGLTSESVYPLPELDPATAVELFGQRARAARPGVELPAGVVEELCGHLDGLPLAIELAAARVRVMSVPEIAAHLEDRFALLRSGARDAPERHRTLHAVVDWSWNLLAPAGQAAMRALSVFPDGFTADAGRRMLGESPLPVLEHLVDQSLLKVADTPVGARFRMLETVREFSGAHREAAGETEGATERFLGWAREFGLAEHGPLLDTDPFRSMARVRAEQDNLVHALRHGLATGDGDTVAATAAVLGALWTVESNFTRMSALAEETAWLLSHYRPEPAYVEVMRTVLTTITVYTFLMQGPRPLRSLVTLRRLPPAPPDTLIRAAAIVLADTRVLVVPDRTALQAHCDSPEPLLASIANCIASYLCEGEGDVHGALKAARRMLESFGETGTPWVRVLAHSRIGELCLHLEQGGEARRHFVAALRVVEDYGLRSDLLQIRWALVIANLQAGAVDEAERWLEQSILAHSADGSPPSMIAIGMRAELLLVKGDVDAGLELWRRAAASTPEYRVEPPTLAPETLEIHAVAVVAHAQHGRLDLVADIVAGLPDKLAMLLTNPMHRPQVYLMELPICGTLLLALGMADLERNPATAVRLIALAEQFHILRDFHPTMSSTRAREAAERADASAYADAVSTYADLGPDELRAAASALMGQRL